MNKHLHSPLILFLSFFILQSCNKFYKPVLVNDNQQALNESVTAGRYFILRAPDANYAMNDVHFDQKNSLVYASLAKIEKAHTKYANHTRGAYKFKPSKGEQDVLNEVHVYTDIKPLLSTTNTIELPLASIQKVETIKYDKRKTVNRRILTSAVILAGIGLVILAGAAAAYASWGYGSLLGPL